MTEAGHTLWQPASDLICPFWFPWELLSHDSSLFSNDVQTIRRPRQSMLVKHDVRGGVHCIIVLKQVRCAHNALLSASISCIFSWYCPSVWSLLKRLIQLNNEPRMTLAQWMLLSLSEEWWLLHERCSKIQHSLKLVGTNVIRRNVKSSVVEATFYNNSS